MKKIKQQKNYASTHTFNNTGSTLLKLIIIVFVLLLKIGLSAQTVNNKLIPSFGLETFSTGNGHGAFYSMYVSLDSKRNSFSAGPLIQKSTLLVNGAKLTYSRKLTIDSVGAPNQDEKDLLQLNFFSSIQYTHNLPLCKKLVNEENLIWGDSKTGINNICYSTGELNVGFELYINITEQISWKNYMGASVYYHFNYSEILDHQKIAPTLNLGTGICFFIQ